MNLQQVQELEDLYPQLRTRSGHLITTNEVASKLTTDGKLAVTVKTIFPPSARRRTELVVAQAGSALHVRPTKPTGLADAQRFAELVRGVLQQEEPAAPLRLVKDPDGVRFWVVAPATADAPVPGEEPADPAAAPEQDPPAADAAEPNAQNGDS